MNRLFLDALQCRNNSRPPVWLMRQAGRYMPEYRALREKHSFLDLCHQPELAATVTQLPINIFGFDAAILFSDILVVAEAFDVGLHFDEGKGPIIDRPLSHASDVDHLPTPDIRHRLDFVAKAISILKPVLKVPLIGFCGAPFTVGSYMIEGGSSRDLKKTKKWMLQDPKSFHKLLQKLTDSTIDYLNMQIDAGVDAIQIFDSWANVLGHQQFREFSLEYLGKIMRGLKRSDIPVILFCRGSSVFAPQLAELRPAAIGLDWNCDIAAMRRVIPSTIALQGNLDPHILYAPHATIRQEVAEMKEKMRGDKGYIFNLGHGICPDISPDAVRILVETIQQKNGVLQ
jgi:uroporphyrinogen decarboxylase